MSVHSDIWTRDVADFLVCAGGKAIFCHIVVSILGKARAVPRDHHCAALSERPDESLRNRVFTLPMIPGATYMPQHKRTAENR